MGDQRADGWQARAACRGAGEVMFPDLADPVAIGAALALCAGCDVRAECLAEARQRRESHGVWGGVLFGRRARRPAPRRKDAGIAKPTRRHLSVVADRLERLGAVGELDRLRRLSLQEVQVLADRERSSSEAGGSVR